MDNLLISKINLGGTTYDIKDAQARTDIESLQNAISGGTHFIGVTTSDIADGANTNPVVIEGENVTAATGDIVIKQAAEGATEPALEFIWDGSKWSELGSTGHLGSLAYKANASSSYTPAGTISADVSSTSANASLTTADYTPAGEVSVTLTNNAVLSSVSSAGVLPTKAADTFTANTPTVIDTTVFNGGSKAADSFTAASMTNTERSAATEGLVASYDQEVLTLSAANTTSVSYITDFNGGSFSEGAFTPAELGDGFYTAGTAASFTEGAFTPGSMPTFNEATVGVQSASFSGTKAENAIVTGVSYNQTTVENLAFAGTAATITVA